MRQRVWFYVIAVVASLGVAYTALTGSLGDFGGGDYPGPACNGCDAAGPPLVGLVHGHVSTFFSTQPVMGSVSLLLRAPFVGLVTWAHGDYVAQYRVGTLICLFVALLLLLPAISLMLRRGQQPLIVLVVLATIVVGPATFKSILWGHPEELLGAALAVAAVLAAVHRRGVAAGALLGLAVATKEWGLLAVLPVLIVARGQRRQVACVAGLTVVVFVLPMFAADPTRFLNQNVHTAAAQLGVTPTNVWWPFHRLGFDRSLHEQINAIPSALRELSHPLVLVLSLGLSLLYWRRSAGRHPYDALQLLALLFLIRCLFDPLTISYHHAPFLLSMAIFEGLRRRGLPVVTLISTAAILLLSRVMAPLHNTDLMNAVYLAWALPTAAYLGASSFGRGIALGRSAAPMEQPAAPQHAFAQ